MGSQALSAFSTCPSHAGSAPTGASQVTPPGRWSTTCGAAGTAPARGKGSATQTSAKRGAPAARSPRGGVRRRHWEKVGAGTRIARQNCAWETPLSANDTRCLAFSAGVQRRRRRGFPSVPVVGDGGALIVETLVAGGVADFIAREITSRRAPRHHVLV